MGNAEYMGSFIKTMAQQGASLQNYNNELVKCLEDLREKREAINREIAREEDDKNKIQNDLKILTERLSRINDSLARKVAARNEYDQSIQETEAAYLKVRRGQMCFGAALNCWVADSGKFSNIASRTQARERKPPEEESGLLISSGCPLPHSITGFTRPQFAKDYCGDVTAIVPVS